MGRLVHQIPPHSPHMVAGLEDMVFHHQNWAAALLFWFWSWCLLQQSAYAAVDVFQFGALQEDVFEYDQLGMPAVLHLQL